MLWTLRFPYPLGFLDWEIECYKPWGTMLSLCIVSFLVLTFFLGFLGSSYNLKLTLVSTMFYSELYHSVILKKWIGEDCVTFPWKRITAWTYVVLLFYSWLVTASHHMRVCAVCIYCQWIFISKTQRFIELIRQATPEGATEAILEGAIVATTRTLYHFLKRM